MPKNKKHFWAEIWKMYEVSSLKPKFHTFQWIYLGEASKKKRNSSLDNA